MDYSLEAAGLRTSRIETGLYFSERDPGLCHTVGRIYPALYFEGGLYFKKYGTDDSAIDNSFEVDR